MWSAPSKGQPQQYGQPQQSASIQTVPNMLIAMTMLGICTYRAGIDKKVRIVRRHAVIRCDHDIDTVGETPLLKPRPQPPNHLVHHPQGSVDLH